MAVEGEGEVVALLLPPLQSARPLPTLPQRKVAAEQVVEAVVEALAAHLRAKAKQASIASHGIYVWRFRHLRAVKPVPVEVDSEEAAGDLAEVGPDRSSNPATTP